MTLTDFLAAVESDLRLRGFPFSRAALEAFVSSSWPLIEDDPDPARWASAFLEAHRQEQPETVPTSDKPALVRFDFPRQATAQEIFESLTRLRDRHFGNRSPSTAEQAQP